MQQPQCRGTNVDGSQCRRIHKLNENKYCHSHVWQDPAHNPNNGNGVEQHPGIIKSHHMQQQQQQEAESDSSFQNQSSINSNNIDNDDIMDLLTLPQQQQQPLVIDDPPPSAAIPAPPPVAPPAKRDKGNLPRCDAIAKSTGSQCLRKVSLLGERFCPTHGGKQIRPVNNFPKCNAISKTTRQPCQNNASGPNQMFCHIHGGAGAVMAALQRGLSPISPSSPSTPPRTLITTTTTPAVIHHDNGYNEDETSSSSSFDNPRCWAEVQSVCLEFIMKTHPASKCPCASTRPCQSMQLVMFMQDLTKLAQKQQASTIFNTKMQDVLRFIPRRRQQHHHHNNINDDIIEDIDDSNNNDSAPSSSSGRGLFSDLFLAVAMFGTNVFFLPRFFHHIQKEAKLSFATATPIYTTSAATRPQAPAATKDHDVHDDDDNDMDMNGDDVF